MVDKVNKIWRASLAVVILGVAKLPPTHVITKRQWLASQHVAWRGDYNDSAKG